MFPLLKMLFRRRCLKKHSSDTSAAMIPLTAVKKATILIDAQDPSCLKCEKEVSSYFRKHDVIPEIIFIDTKRYRKGENPVTAPEKTISRKRLNWFGRPDKNMLSAIEANGSDLFISLADRTDFPVMLISSASRARFKIGCKSAGKDPFSIILSSDMMPEATSYERFRKIADLLEMVKTS